MIATGLLIGGIIFLVGGILLIVIPCGARPDIEKCHRHVHDETHGCARDIQRNVGAGTSPSEGQLVDVMTERSPGCHMAQSSTTAAALMP